MTPMRAVRAHQRGGPEVLRYEVAPVPEVGTGEVLVEVHAAAVTPGELAWEETWRSADGADRAPIIPSHEFTGVIVVARPLHLPHVESAALPLAALTAWQALSDHARVQPGERVFIQGGAGGVGSLAVQLAKALGRRDGHCDQRG